ncbi:MAG: hypothetical protein ABIG03_08115 [Candidatus Eisenbacteria bacterium]
MSRKAMLLLVAAVLVHAVFVASLIEPGHFLNPLFVEGVHNLEEGQGSDFYAFYQAGRYVLEGDDIYRRPMDDPDRVVPYAYFYRYLPFVAYTIGVATNAVPPRVAYWLWVSLIELSLLACLFATRRMTKDAWLFAQLAAMWLLFSPFYLEQYMGQLTFAMAALVFAFALAHARGRRRAFDWSWIVSLLVKHLTILYLPILVRMKRYKLILIGLGLLLATTVPYLLLRPAGVGDFTHDNFSLNLNPAAGNYGLLAFLMVVKYHFFPTASEFFATIGPLGISWTRIMLAAAMGVPTLVCLWITFFRRPFDFLESVALWTILFFFVFREVWEYHYVILIPVMVLLYARTRARVLWVVYAFLAAPTFFVLYDVPGPNPEASWTVFEHVFNHAYKIAPVVWLFVWVAVGHMRRHARAVDARADGRLAITF